MVMSSRGRNVMVNSSMNSNIEGLIVAPIVVGIALTVNWSRLFTAHDDDNDNRMISNELCEERARKIEYYGVEL
jgi:hypothetical protein